MILNWSAIIPSKTILKKMVWHSSIYVAFLILAAGIFVFIDRKNHIETIKNSEYFDIKIKSEFLAPVFKKIMTSFIILCDEYERLYVGKEDLFFDEHNHLFRNHGDYERLVIRNPNGRDVVTFSKKGSLPVPASQFSMALKRLEKIEENALLITYNFFDQMEGEARRIYLFKSVGNGGVAALAVNVDGFLEGLLRIMGKNIGKIYLVDESLSRYIPISKKDSFQPQNTEKLAFFTSNIVNSFLRTNEGQRDFAEGLITFDHLVPSDATDITGINSGRLNIGEMITPFYFKKLLLISYVPNSYLDQITFSRVHREILFLMMAVLFILILNYLYTAAKISKENSERQLAAQNSQVQRQAHMATLGELTAGIAHEINNPLTILVSATEELLWGIENESMEKKLLLEQATIAKETTVRIANVVKGMRSVTRDAQNDAFEKVPVYSIVNDAIVILKIRLKKCELHLQVEDIPKELVIECRAAQISQILLNLLGNAIDAVGEQKDAWICLQVLDRMDQIDIVITDCGQGIPATIVSKLFDQFFTTKKKGEGTGLGLSISKRIIEEHQGQLVLNRDCPNTQFVVTLPKRQLLT